MAVSPTNDKNRIGYNELPQELRVAIIRNVVQADQPLRPEYPALGNPFNYFPRQDVEFALGSMPWLELRVEYYDVFATSGSLIQNLCQALGALPFSLPRRWNDFVARPHATIAVQPFVVPGLPLFPDPNRSYAILVPLDPRVTCQLVSTLFQWATWGVQLNRLGVGPGLTQPEKKVAMEALLPMVVFGRLTNTNSRNAACDLPTWEQERLVSEILRIDHVIDGSYFCNLDLAIKYVDYAFTKSRATGEAASTLASTAFQYLYGWQLNSRQVVGRPNTNLCVKLWCKFKFTALKGRNLYSHLEFDPSLTPQDQTNAVVRMMQREDDALRPAGIYGSERKAVHDECAKSCLNRARLYRPQGADSQWKVRIDYASALAHTEASLDLGDSTGQLAARLDSLKIEAAQVGIHRHPTTWHASNGSIQERVPDWLMHKWQTLGYREADFSALNLVPVYRLPSLLRADTLFRNIVEGP